MFTNHQIAEILRCHIKFGTTDKVSAAKQLVLLNTVIHRQNRLLK